MAHPKRTVYDLLAKKTIEEVTTAQLAASVESTAVDKETIEFWKGPITIQRVLELRTYPWGLPIPEAGSIFFEEVLPLGVITIRPTGSEIWEIKALRGFGDGGACTTATAYEDGTSSLIFKPTNTIAQSGTNYDLNDNISTPIILTNSLYLTITETGGSQGLRIQAAYQVVGL